VHAPFWQLSLCVHALLSLQAVPFGRGCAWQAPVAGTQTPMLHALSRLLQETGVPGWQARVPRLQVSTPLQGFPSLQSPSTAQPQALASKLQPLGSPQLSTVHAMPSVQLRAEPLHPPARQVSPVVHARPSLQVVPSGLFGFEQVPFVGLHVPAS
jgi:hypothetical protein